MDISLQQPAETKGVSCRRIDHGLRFDGDGGRSATGSPPVDGHCGGAAATVDPIGQMVAAAPPRRAVQM
jgi:hypothetical protein